METEAFYRHWRELTTSPDVSEVAEALLELLDNDEGLREKVEGILASEFSLYEKPTFEYDEAVEMVHQAILVWALQKFAPRWTSDDLEDFQLEIQERVRHCILCTASCPEGFACFVSPNSLGRDYLCATCMSKSVKKAQRWRLTSGQDV